MWDVLRWVARVLSVLIVVLVGVLWALSYWEEVVVWENWVNGCWAFVAVEDRFAMFMMPRQPSLTVVGWTSGRGVRASSLGVGVAFPGFYLGRPPGGLSGWVLVVPSWFSAGFWSVSAGLLWRWTRKKKTAGAFPIE